MLFQLLKDLPFMFVIAAIIWVVIIIFFIKTIRNKKSPSKKLITITIFIITGIILTAIDIWLFVFFIPTHFKKINSQQQTTTISAIDIAKEIQTTDTSKIALQKPEERDSLKKKKIDTLKVENKIYATNQASVTFLSHGEDEDIEATNAHSAIAFNNSTGALKVIALIKGFQFDNQLMQDHFNEPNYMNSNEFPKSEFKGKIIDFKEINFSKNGIYSVDIEGSLIIHGITKNISAKGTFTITNKRVSAQSTFKIKRIDYGITTNEIADELQITVKGILQ